MSETEAVLRQMRVIDGGRIRSSANFMEAPERTSKCGLVRSENRRTYYHFFAALISLFCETAL